MIIKKKALNSRLTIRSTKFSFKLFRAISLSSSPTSSLSGDRTVSITKSELMATAWLLRVPFLIGHSH